MSEKSKSYLSPKLEMRPCVNKEGSGVFAVQQIDKGELLTVWSGEIYTAEQLNQVSLDRQTHGLQVEEDLYLLPLSDNEPADFFNHSCDPNAGLSGQICLIAMRQISPGEEVCFDYAMSDSSDYDEFACSCGLLNCRGRITGADWKLPELQERYRGYFMPYLQRKIDSLNNAGWNDEIKAESIIQRRVAI